MGTDAPTNRPARSWRLLLVTLVLLVGATNRCTTTSLPFSTSTYDHRRITIQTLSLFNQRALPGTPKSPWQGDWIFRRERLERVDEDMRTVKPDVVVFQEAMRRSKNSAESDKNILSAGAMMGYQWQSAAFETYHDTEETEEAMVATGLPLRFSAKKPDPTIKRYDGGYFVAFVIESETGSIALFNVQEPNASDRSRWALDLQSEITETLTNFEICAERTIIAGKIRSSNLDPHIRPMISTFRLKDVSEGRCEQESSCYTASPVNDLFQFSNRERSPAREDKILVHKDTLIYFSSRNFDTPSDFPYRLRSNFRISNLWASIYFGWVASIRLARCP